MEDFIRNIPLFVIQNSYKDALSRNIYKSAHNTFDTFTKDRMGITVMLALA